MRDETNNPEEMKNSSSPEGMVKLSIIQNELRCSKNQRNTFGNYNYRSVADIYEAVKPLLAQYGGSINITNQLEEVGGNTFIKSTATFQYGDYVANSTAYAAIDWGAKGMNQSQVCGSATSYANKYAIGALLLIDDSCDELDPDSNSYQIKNKTSNMVVQGTALKNSVDKVDKSEIFNAQTIDDLKTIWTKVEKLKEGKEKDFLTKLMTKRKGEILAKTNC